jgi:hypothetical protein
MNIGNSFLAIPDPLIGAEDNLVVSDPVCW